MTRQMFIDYAIKNNPYNQDKQQIGFTPYDREELHSKILKVYSCDFNDEKILDFCANVGSLYFNRTEIVTGDKLTIDIRWKTSIEFWKDIDSVVNRIAQIENCSGIIEVYFISDTGKFYNHKHELIAESEELFFEYLTTVEFDYHPVIMPKVYDVLRQSGWSEKRHLDTRKFCREMKNIGITLTQSQLDYFSKFSGISFTCDSEFCEFYSMSYVLTNHIEFIPTVTKNGIVVAENVLEVGNTFSGQFHIDSNGILLFMADEPIGRTTLEGVNYLVKETFCWQLEPN